MPRRQIVRKFYRILTAALFRLRRKRTDTLNGEPPHIPSAVQCAQELTHQSLQPRFRQWLDIRRTGIPSLRTARRVKMSAQPEVNLVANANSLIESKQNRVKVKLGPGASPSGAARRIGKQFAKCEWKLLPHAEVAPRASRRTFKRRVATAPHVIQVVVGMA